MAPWLRRSALPAPSPVQSPLRPAAEPTEAASRYSRYPVKGRRRPVASVRCRGASSCEDVIIHTGIPDHAAVVVVVIVTERRTSLLLTLLLDRDKM